MNMELLYDNEFYLDPLVNSITWSGDITQAFRKLEVSITNTIDGTEQAVDIELGRELRLLSDGTELFRGIIFQHNIDARGKMKLTAYDENIYLTKNTDTKKFIHMTASAIIRELCADFGIAVGDIADTEYVIPKLILRDKTLWDMMVTALTETRKQTGQRFWLSAREGAVYLTKRGDKVTDWVLEDTTNLTGASYSQSIENLRTQVKVIGSNESKQPLERLAKNPDLIERFGVMQHLERVDSEMNLSQMEQQAKQLIEDLGKIKDEASVEAVGNVEVTAGSAVYVRDSLTRIVGAFYVITDSHTFENGAHRMSLTISGDESLPRMEYEAPPDDAG
ncbi:hypothetical protein SK3146_03233 [Paenibacillus konkukensis]|uniref:YqbQ/XkdQ domain-containing protein n=1 Tax=Paenibacillus konkukensis TaxID=2020716 RepID=A0ABY4RNL1_9BACL|nr:hypothetical protein [Paenibacillus konkukensis]UQZ84021.1 hypothetical protein SK3146_03233 [Paenibacillus konkukensis]